jgi:hypothetical protein
MPLLGEAAEVPAVVEQEETSTGKNPAVIKRIIDDEFTLASFFSPKHLARGAGRLLLPRGVIYPLLERVA